MPGKSLDSNRTLAATSHVSSERFAGPSCSYAFEFHEHKHIPVLAWTACLKRNRAVIDVHHGPWVETGHDFFVEGAWNGSFPEGRFDKSTVFFGSGGRIISNGSVVFATPTHKWEKLILIKKNDAIFISNSLVFILLESNCQLDESFGKYNEALWTIKNGIRSYTKQMPLKDGYVLNVYYHRNIFIDPALSVSESFKSEPEDTDFDDFRSYENFLDMQTAKIFNNAMDAGRKIKYQPITTLSSGYDSACSSVFAKRNGCQEALSFSNDGGKDSGAAVAKKLSLSITEVDRFDYLKSERKFIEGEIFSAGFGIAGLYFLSFEKYIKGRILVTGYYGGDMWERDNNFNNDQLRTLRADGSAYTEFRLRVGFIHFILPSMGATKDPLVKAISYSDEMKQWLTGSKKYDRPIPARIIMEANVPRHLFAQSKQASGIFNVANKKVDIKSPKSKAPLLQKIKQCIPEAQKMVVRKKRKQLRDLSVKLATRISRAQSLRYDIVTIRSALTQEAQKDLYGFLKRHKKASFLTGRFMWGIEKAKANYVFDE